MSNKYYISTYSAKSFIQNYKVENVPGTDNYDIHFEVDYRKPSNRSLFLKSTDLSDDTAMYYQFRKIMNIKDGDVTANDIIQEIIIMDFHNDAKTSLFDKLEPASKEMLDREYKDASLLKSWSNEINDDFRLRKLFDNGVDIIYENRTVRYVPFDKSNSMARDNRITFVNREHLQELTKRLNLDIDFSQFDVTLSKYYAYRGLYLTTADRFDIYRDELKALFNEDTVIVVPDAKINKRSENIITAEREKTGSNKWIPITDAGVTEDLAFDGEGIISPELTEEINSACGYSGVSSLQIRMPFVKGMLHEVDFKRFVREEILEDPDADTYEIYDAFNVKRNLLQAHIIIPKSMFKCHDWLLKMIKNLHPELEEEAPNPYAMEYYFEKFHKYNHCMYISNTDEYYGISARTNLNYQFFNTLDIRPEEVKALMSQDKGQYYYIENPMEYIDIASADKGRESDEKYDDAVDDAEEEELGWKDALKANPVLSHEKMINELLTSQSNRLRRDIAKGRVIVDGEIRYLSRDLLRFLLYIIEGVYDSDKDDKGKGYFDEDISYYEDLDQYDDDPRLYSVSQNIKRISAKTLGEEQFYMPDNKIALKADQYYPLFRNPHLSRNEQCIATPYIVSGESDIYKKYFSHLNGVLMVGYSSLVPQALGGADFDGDIVKVVSDEIIIRAAVRGVLDKKRKGERIRKLPIIKIPAADCASKTPVPDHVSYEVIRNTFSNSIGRISNVSVRLGDIEYGLKDKHESKKAKHSCSECTILTGLEIDSAKTGEHPDLSGVLGDRGVKWDRQNNVDGDYILFKERIDDIYRSHHRIFADEQGYCYRRKEDVGNISAAIYKHGTNPSVRGLNTLPECFFKSLDIPVKLFGEKEGNRYIYFDFLADKDWKQTVSQELLEAASAVIRAYYDLSKLVSNSNKLINRYKSRNYMGHVCTIFEMQYGREETEKIRTEEYENLYDYVNDCFDELVDVQAAIVRLKESNWAFVREDKRPEVLEFILGRDLIDYETITGERVTKLLCNRNAQGYNVLYFILNDIESDILVNMPDKEIYESVEALGTGSVEKSKDSENDEKFKSVREELYKVLTDLKSEKRSDAIGVIFARCIRMLEDICVGLDDYDRLKLFWALTNVDARHKFFWKMVPVKCMNEHIPATSSGTEANPEEGC